MRVLVTGGAGFIGSHLSEQLLRDGHDIAIVDELNEFYSSNEKRSNLESVRRCADFAFWQTDITDSIRVGDIFTQFQPEAVVHLAARAGVRPSLAAPVLYEQANVIGTLNLLEASRALASPPRFILGSSSSVYGISRRLPFREDNPLEHPVSPYAVSKLAAEKYCYSYTHLYGIPTVCLRFFTVYGPRQRPDLAIRKFAEQILEGRPIPVFGDGATSRDYTYVSDIVAGIRGALLLNQGHEVINLGNSSPISLTDMVKTLAQALNVPAKIDRQPEQPGDVPTTYADVSKARRLLHYKPAVSFPDGILRFVEWLKSREQG